MAKPSDKRLERRLVNEIRYGIARAFHDQEKPPAWISTVMGIKRNSVGGTINCISDLNQLPPWLQEQIVGTIGRINCNEAYERELTRLVKMAKSQADDKPKVNEQATTLSYCKRTYAEGMAGLWYKLCARKTAEIFNYQPKVVSPRVILEGNFWMLPKNVLPATVQKTQYAKRPYLGLNFDDDKLQLCDEDAGTLMLKIIGVNKTSAMKTSIPEPTSLESKTVYDICFNFFKRNQYDLRKDLGMQIRDRHKSETTSVAIRERLQLIRPVYGDR